MPSSRTRRAKGKAARRTRRKVRARCVMCDNLADLPNFSFDGTRFSSVRLAKVYDGDTITIVAPMGATKDLCKLKCRVADLDACEIRGEFAEHGREARLELVKRLNCKIDPDDKYNERFFSDNVVLIDVLCGKFDKYGRVLVYVAPVGGEWINETICETEHFAEYDGKGPRPAKGHTV